MNASDQKQLLRRFEPVLKFTQGEQFFPYHVSEYVHRASLWVQSPDAPSREVVSESALDLEQLGRLQLTGAHDVHYLQFISPMNIRELAEYQLSRLRETIRDGNFRPSRSRLARVGYLARLIDMIFSIALLLRGRVPGDTMMAAMATFSKMLAAKREFQYFGRVIQQNGWMVLQYWYFYPFNNWRSGFFGANDHEADWEMINIYCYQSDSGRIVPEWVAYARHDVSGDDLRRHWSDPEVEKIGEHPVAYVGGGSHAAYFQPGEYLTQLSVPLLKPLRSLRKALVSFFRSVFRDEPRARRADGSDSSFSVPFIDYALGDGAAIGVGGRDPWADPEVIEPAPDWVMNFRGLWGYYARDPFAGEDAPAGPRYNRDGSVRLAWFDPLSWSGLDKVVPPDEMGRAFNERKEKLKATINALSAEIHDLQHDQIERGMDLAAFHDVPHLSGEVKRLEKRLAEDRRTLIDLRERLTLKESALEAYENFLQKDQAERQPNLRGHIQYAHQPRSKRNLRFPVLAEVWAAVSIGVIMIAVVLLILFARPFLLWGLGALLLVMITIEAAFRRRLSTLVRWTAVGLAAFGLFILLYEFFWVFILVLLMGIGFYMIIENLRELIARR